jgi:hypothetical protein
MTSAQALKKLVARARSDPRFFHQLVFKPEKAIKSLTFLDAKSKAALLRVNADTIIRNLVPGDSSECAGTCGAGSCDMTCGTGSCLDTCKSSCGSTCGNSCDRTSGMGEKFIPDDPFKGGVVAKGVGVGKVAGAAARARRGQR